MPCPRKQGQDKQILQVNAGAAPPGGVVVEVERKPRRFRLFAIRIFCDQALKARMLPEAIAQQVGLSGLRLRCALAHRWRERG